MSDTLTQLQPPGLPGGLLYGDFAKAAAPPTPTVGRVVVVQTYVAAFAMICITPAEFPTTVAPAEFTTAALAIAELT